MSHGSCVLFLQCSLSCHCSEMSTPDRIFYLFFSCSNNYDWTRRRWRQGSACSAACNASNESGVANERPVNAPAPLDGLGRDQQRAHHVHVHDEQPSLLDESRDAQAPIVAGLLARRVLSCLSFCIINNYKSILFATNIQSQAIDAYELKVVSLRN